MFGPSKSEKKSIKYRRSLYIVENVKKDEIASLKNVRSIRPSGGLYPINLKKIIGRKFKKKFDSGTPLRWTFLK